MKIVEKNEVLSQLHHITHNKSSKAVFSTSKGEQINETSKHYRVITCGLSQSYASCSVSGSQLNVTRSNIIQVDPSGVCLQSLVFRNFGFESRRAIDVSFVSVVWCQVEFNGSG
jgi:hypothetical protein